MAKVVMPLNSLAARGKMGAIIYNTWRGLNTVKAFKAPVQPGSTDQLDMRARLTNATRAWAALSASQRTSWNDYATAHPMADWSSTALRLTGQNWFVRCYVIIALCGGTPPTTAPTTAAPDSITGAGFAYVSGPPKKVTLTWSAPTDANSYLQMWKTPALSTGRVPKFEMAEEFATLISSTSSPYDAVNPITAGRYGFWVRVLSKTTGLFSAFVSADLTVT